MKKSEDVLDAFSTDPSRIQYLIENRRKLEDLKFEFAVKYGFAYKRAQDFKHCLVIRWKNSRVKYKIVYPKIEEYAKICNDLSYKYLLWDEKDPFLEASLRLIKANIYCFTDWSYQSWSIPDEFKEVQEHVLGVLPKWVKIIRKK